MDAKKEAALAERVGPNILASLLQQVEQAEKAADTQRIAHKEARVAVWDEAAQSWQEVTTKAPPPAPPEEEPVVDPEAELPDEELVDEEPDEGGYFSAEELAEITSAVAPAVAAAVIEQLGPMLNMEAKMGKFTDELKGMFAPQMAQKDAALAEQAALVATLKAQQSAIEARLKELEGDQPAARGFRASQSEATVLSDTSTLKQQPPQGDPNFLQFFGGGQ